MREYRDIDVVLSKALGVLGQAELLQPVRDVLHCNPPQIYRGLTAILDEGDREFIRKIPREYTAGLIQSGQLPMVFNRWR
jgi:hypothetical protein